MQPPLRLFGHGRPEVVAHQVLGDGRVFGRGVLAALAVVDHQVLHVVCTDDQRNPDWRKRPAQQY